MIGVLSSRQMFRLWILVSSTFVADAPMLTKTLGAQSVRVASTPFLRINSPDSGIGMFEAVAGATRLSDGRIVVGNRGEHALLVFNAKGHFERALARKGRGPGEVSSLLAIYRCGDRIITSDIIGDRMQIFSPSLEYERAFRFKRVAYRRACNADGRFVHMGWDDGASDSPSRTTTPYWISSSDSSAGTPLGSFPGDERIGGMPLPLGASPRIAIGRDRVYIAPSDSLFVLAFSLDGNRATPLRSNSQRARVTPADVDAALERDVRVMGEKSRSIVAGMHAKAPRKSFLPATRDVLVDTEGLIWVQHYPQAGKASVPWTVFRSDGRTTFSVQLPSELEVFEIGRDFLIGALRDPDTDLPQILVYAVSR